MTKSANTEERDTVVLLHDVEGQGPGRSDVEAVVHRSDDADAYEVEFVTGERGTVAVLTLGADEIRLVDRREILHARKLVA